MEKEKQPANLHSHDIDVKTVFLYCF